MGDRERLFGYLEGGGQDDSVEPAALLTEASKMPGLDGQKMSKSYNNTDHAARGRRAASRRRSARCRPIRRACRRTDPGDPEKCPVWQFHLGILGRQDARVGAEGLHAARGIGCLECKQPVIDAVLREQEPMRERAQKATWTTHAGAQHHRGRVRPGAQDGRRRRCATCARRWGSATPETYLARSMRWFSLSANRRPFSPLHALQLRPLLRSFNLPRRG